ncbi:hypothetical protein HS1_000401 [Candidatus Desulfofervidus auxilii]|uniref:Uncharacterized protein n=1 Tax=Desulfofervidus auxilii TaxID=1621989 RepID=A0A7U4QIX3_DESA2|nr:hypothetical protein [Candidatus Desulfofervidus auxilii]AMM40207.1 hypothetical protein HS1_000401 [Candidatus Desulfofervidus auxilii]CAD7770877.1 hypothetical protein BLFGPEAP_00462 [Candidatus Methanoperedenaceae archaeon GB50]
MPISKNGYELKMDLLKEKTIKGIFWVGNILAVDVGMKEEVDIALLLLGR